MLVDAREKLHIPWGEPDNQQHGGSVMAFDTRSAKMASGQLETSVFLQYLPAIRALWADSGIQHAYDRRREFQLVGGGGGGVLGKGWKKKVKVDFCAALVSLPASGRTRGVLSTLRYQ